MIDREKIEERLEKLREYFLKLKEYQDTPREKFVEPILGMVERYLHLGIEAMIDIGEIIIASLKLRKPETNKEVFLILAEGEILPKDFALRVSLAAGFRNILVHGYVTVDSDLVYKHLREDLDDFEEFVKHVTVFLEKS